MGATSVPGVGCGLYFDAPSNALQPKFGSAGAGLATQSTSWLSAWLESTTHRLPVSASNEKCGLRTPMAHTLGAPLMPSANGLVDGMA